MAELRTAEKCVGKSQEKLDTKGKLTPHTGYKTENSLENTGSLVPIARAPAGSEEARESNVF